MIPLMGTPPTHGSIAIPENKFDAFRQGEILGKAFVYCEQVSLGSKPVAELMCPIEFSKLVEVEIEKFALLFEKTRLSEDWVDYEIFKNAMYRNILAAHRDMCSLNIPAAKLFKEWSVGKMFGYSDASISEYLQESYHV